MFYNVYLTCYQYRAYDQGYPDHRAEPSDHREDYRDDEYPMGSRGDPHRYGDYDPRPDCPLYDFKAPPRAPPPADYATPYDQDFDRRCNPSPPRRHHDDNGHHDRRDEPDHPHEDHRARMQKSVRVEVPVFDGSREPKDFIDWESSMNYYFHWYHMNTNLCVEYAKMRLGEHGKIFWEIKYLAAEGRGLLITTWAEIFDNMHL